MYFVGRPGEDGFADRFLETWGCDGHNSHTNVCSSGGRAGYGLWMGTDRPSPDYANAKFTLLISSHLEAGHYFNPHAQRMLEEQAPRRQDRRRRPAVCPTPPRWPTTGCRPGPAPRPRCCWRWPRSCSTRTCIDRDFVRRWVNWRSYLEHRAPGAEPGFERFLSRAARRIRAVHAGVRRGRDRRARRDRRRRSRARSPPPRPRSPRTSGARPPPATCTAGRSPARCGCSTCSRARSARSAASRRTPGTSSSPRRGASPRPTSSGTSSTGRASTRSRTTR